MADLKAKCNLANAGLHARDTEVQPGRRAYC